MAQAHRPETVPRQVLIRDENTSESSWFLIPGKPNIEQDPKYKGPAQGQ
jgi:hypothetical protein